MLTIRPVESPELETLRTFAEHTFRVAYEHSNDPVHFKNYCDISFTLQQFRKEWEHPGSKFWFALLEDQLAAYLKLNFDHHPPELKSASTVQVERIYVAPDLQGRRIGEQLLDFAQEQARLIGADWLWLSVWQANPPALRFYERCGYEIFGTEVFQVGDDAQLDWLVRKKV